MRSADLTDPDARYRVPFRPASRRRMAARAITADVPDVSLEKEYQATRRSFLALAAALVGPAAAGQDKEEAREKSALRLDTMRRLAKEVKVSEITEGKPGAPLPLRPEPLLHYSNVAGNMVDGTLWRWGQRGRPAVVLKLGLRGPMRGQRHWNFSFNALSAKCVEIELSDGQAWSSRPPGEHQPRAVPEAPTPADTASQRLTQAKTIARRFSLSEQTPAPSGRIQLRLLAQPVDRYSDPTGGLLDGVLFTFVYATTPEVHLVLEAWSAGAGAPTWHYALARHGAAEETALLDGKPVWSVPFVLLPANADTYMTRPMPADPAVQD